MEVPTQAEHLNIYIWILSGVLTFLISLLIIVGSSMAKNLGKQIEELTNSMNRLVNINIQQTEQIKTIFENQAAFNKRVDAYSERIRKIELTCAGYHKGKKDEDF